MSSSCSSSTKTIVPSPSRFCAFHSFLGLLWPEHTSRLAESGVCVSHEAVDGRRVAVIASLKRLISSKLRSTISKKDGVVWWFVLHSSCCISVLVLKRHGLRHGLRLDFWTSAAGFPDFPSFKICCFESPEVSGGHKPLL